MAGLVPAQFDPGSIWLRRLMLETGRDSRAPGGGRPESGRCHGRQNGLLTSWAIDDQQVPMS
jgi:hypothetical protein